MVISTFEFFSESSPFYLKIDINEILEEDYGFYVWPCSRVLAEYIWQNKTRFIGKRVLEIGSGTSLPGILASKIGSSVTLTDLTDNPSILENIRQNCQLNSAPCEVMGLNWGDFSCEVCSVETFDYILGSDVLFDSSIFPILFSTVKFFLEKSAKKVNFITAYQHRSGHHSLEFFMAYFNLKCSKITKSDDIMDTSESNLHSSIYIIEISL